MWFFQSSRNCGSVRRCEAWPPGENAFGAVRRPAVETPGSSGLRIVPRFPFAVPKKAGLEYLCFGQMIKANVGNIVLRVSKASSDSIMLKCMRKQVGAMVLEVFFR